MLNIGGAVTNTGSTESNKTGSWRSKKPVVDKAGCIKCKTCEKFCPEPCIKVTDAADIDYDYCKGCGICANVCPAKCITMVNE